MILMAAGEERVSLVNISGKKISFLLEFDYLCQPLCFQHPATSLGGIKSGKEIQGNFQFLQMYPQIKQRTL